MHALRYSGMPWDRVAHLTAWLSGNAALQADALLGCFRFLGGYYMLFALKKRLQGSVCGMPHSYSCLGSDALAGLPACRAGRTQIQQIHSLLLQARRSMLWGRQLHCPWCSRKCRASTCRYAPSVP